MAISVYPATSEHSFWKGVKAVHAAEPSDISAAVLTLERRIQQESANAQSDFIDLKAEVAKLENSWTEIQDIVKKKTDDAKAEFHTLLTHLAMQVKAGGQLEEVFRRITDAQCRRIQRESENFRKTLEAMIADPEPKAIEHLWRDYAEPAGVLLVSQ